MNETIELGESHSYRNPQAELLICLKNDNLEEFQYNLDKNVGESIDINHLYEDADNKSLLEIACSSKHKTKYVELLLQYGANVNQLNKFNGQAPIHLAVLHSDYNTLRLLVENENTDVNKPDTSGHTALYLASQHRGEDLANLLQKRMTSEGNKNSRFQTNINIDLKDEKQPLVQDADYPDPTDRRSIGENLDLLQQNEGESSGESLRALLHSRNYEAFAIKANENNVGHSEYSSPHLTYLQYACKCGLTPFVRLLLDLKVDPNETSLQSRKPPIMIAAYNGHYDIVKLLVDTHNIAYTLVDGDTILHIMFLGEMMKDSPAGESNRTFGSKHQEFYKCLEHLLTNVPNSQLDVNLLNQRGKTVLHYAVSADNRDVILLLLQKGAYIGIANSKGEMPVKFMKAATLEYFLDTAISSKRHSLRRDHRIIISYNLLVCKGFDSLTIKETKPLVAISEVPQLRPLLKHPFCTAFLDLKWYIIMNKLTLMNYFFYTLFVLFLSFYLLIAYVPITTKLIVENNNTQNNTPIISQNKTVPLNMYFKEHKFKEIEIILWYIVLILNSILFLREFLQFLVYSNSNKYRYIKNPENWIEVSLIAITFVILFAQIDSTENRSLLSVTAIFLSWIELMLLILSHPITSVHITMFKAVAWNSFKFLLCYLILIVAFALSFYLLFKDTSPEFKDIILAIFKTGVMSAGEYEVSNNPFDSEFGIRHLLFVLFIFLVPIVLFNLLNGVAISDIQGIRNNAELVSTVARVKLIAHMEEIISDLLSFLDKQAYHYATLIRRQSDSQAREYCNQLKQRNYRYINLFSTLSEDGKVYITPYYNNAIFIKSRKSEATDTPSSKYPMPKPFISASVIETIKEKLSQRASNSDVSHGQGISEVKQAVTNLQQMCENTSDRLRIIEQKLAEITELLREKL